MAIDPSIPLQVNGAQPQQPANPLQMLTTFSQLQQRANQNQLFQSEFAARNAIGKAFSGAIGSNGKVDLGEVERRMAADPAAAFKSPEIMLQLEQRKQTQIQTAKAQLEIANQYLGITDGALSALANKGDSITRKDVVDSLTKLSTRLQVMGVDYGLADPDHLAQVLMQVPEGGTGIQDMVRQALLRNMDAKQRADTMFGQMKELDMGNRISVQQQIPFNGTSTEVKSLPKAMSPFEATTPAEINTTGGPVTTTRGEIGRAGLPGAKPDGGGGGGEDAPSGDGGGGGGLPPEGEGGGGTEPNALERLAGPAQGPSAAPVGDMPEGTQMAQAGPAPVAPGIPMARGPAVVKGMTPETKAYRENSGKEMADYEKTLNDTVSVGQSVMKRMDETRDLMKDIRLGGGSKLRASLGEFAQNLGLPSKWADEIAGGNLAGSQEFQKFAVQGALENLRQTLAGASSKINMLEYDSFQKNNPNLDTDPRAVEKIYNFAAKLYRMSAAEQTALNAAKKDGSFNPTTWPNVWAREAESRGYVKSEDAFGLNRETKALPTAKSRRPMEDILKEFQNGR